MENCGGATNFVTSEPTPAATQVPSVTVNQVPKKAFQNVTAPRTNSATSSAVSTNSTPRVTSSRYHWWNPPWLSPRIGEKRHA